MNNLKNAVDTIYQLNTTPFKVIFDDFNKYSNQNIPQSVYEEWIYTGLNNKDYLFSDYLIQCGYKNYQMVYQEKMEQIDKVCSACGKSDTIRYDKHQISVDAKTQPYFDISYSYCEECGHHFNYDID